MSQTEFDKAVQHQVDVRRFSSHEVLLLLALLDDSNERLIEFLRMRASGVKLGSVRMKNVLTRVDKMRAASFKEINKQLRDDLRRFAKIEASFERGLLGTKAADTGPLLRKPYVGRTLAEWIKAMAAADHSRVTAAIKLAIAEKRLIEDTLAMVKAAVNRTRDNLIQTVRTAVTFVSDEARSAFWKGGFLRWTAILDGKTSAICRSRDGALVKLGSAPIPNGETALDPQGARPPAHPNCRSFMVHIPAGSNLPERESYGDWLMRQPEKFQDSVLGYKRAGLFRTGTLALSEFVDISGRELSLDKLEALYPKLF